LPEAESAVGDRELWAHGKPAPLEVEQELAECVSGRRIRVNITPRRLGDPAVLIGAFDRAIYRSRSGTLGIGCDGQFDPIALT
jgi:hypothetical protein